MAVRLRASLLSVGLLASVAAGALGYQTACGSSREPTAIFLAVSTDLVVTEDLDAVGLFVSVNGEIKHGQVEKVRPGGVLALPGTISIVDPEDPTTPVHIRVVGYKTGQVVSVRDAISTVPPNRISVLRLPIQWLSGGPRVGGKERTDTGTTPANGNVRLKADPIGNDHFPEFARYFENLVLPCPVNQTMVNGECRGLDVTELLLPSTGGDHVAQVFGGASGVDQAGAPAGGACFPVADCFAGAERIALADLGDGCSVAKSDVPVDRVNFGIRRKSCTEDRCTIGLDYTPEPGKATAPGWYEKDGRYQLPKGICDPAVRRDSVVEVLVTTKCKNKVAAMPTCGVWSAVSTAAAIPEPIGPYLASSRDAGVDAPDSVAPGPWNFDTVRSVGQDVPSAVGLALSADRIWVVGRTGRAAGYLRSNPAAVPESFSFTSDAAAPAFPFVAAGNRTTVATLAAANDEFAFVFHNAGVTKQPIMVLGQSTGVFVTNRDEPVFVARMASSAGLKVYPPDGGAGVIHNLVGSTAHHASSLDLGPSRKVLLAAEGEVLSVDLPLHEAAASPMIPTAIEASVPVAFQTYRALHALGTTAGIFWSAYDPSAAPNVMRIFRAPRGGGAMGAEWTEALPVSDQVTNDVSPVVGDTEVVFFSNGRTVYGKRVASTIATPPVVLHTAAATESLLGLAYDSTTKSLYAVTEGGRLFGGPVVLP